MGREVELKLDLSAKAATALAESGLLGRAAVPRQLVTIYFDTPRGHLQRHGLTLRIRREGRRMVQTVKARNGPAAGLFARSEWEWPVAAMAPEIDERTPVAKALGGQAGELVPCFTVTVERARFTLSEGESRMAVALDRGQVAALDRTAAFVELELELECGHPRDLFAVARRLDRAAPVRIGALSKADRGFRLIAELRDHAKAGAPRLDPALGPVGACAAIVTDCLHHYRVNEAILLAQRVPEALHQARVALRRLRSAHAVFAPLLRDDTSARLDGEVRRLARILGVARDFDVLWERSGPERRARLAAGREQAWRQVAAALGSAATRHLFLDLAEWSLLGTWREAPETAAQRSQPLTGFAAAALDRRLRRVSRHGHHLAELADEARHTLRKDAKKLRYAVEFFAALHDKGGAARHRKRFLAALKELQDQLGALNDLAVERRLLGSAGPGEDEAAARLLHRAAAARHALLECGAYW